MNERIERPGRESEPWRPTFRQIVAGLGGLVVLIFALVNLEDANVDFVFGDVKLPLFFVIVGAALIGALAGYLMARHRHRED